MRACSTTAKKGKKTIGYIVFLRIPKNQVCDRLLLQNCYKSPYFSDVSRSSSAVLSRSIA